MQRKNKVPIGFGLIVWIGLFIAIFIIEMNGHPEMSTRKLILIGVIIASPISLIVAGIIRIIIWMFSEDKK